MFFTKTGAIVAGIAMVLGVLSLILGYEVGFNQTESIFAEAFRIDSVQKATAQSKLSISQGYIVLFCGLVLGILTEISRSVADLRE